MDIDINSYHKMTSRAQGISLLSLDDIMSEGTVPKFSEHTAKKPSSFDELEKKELKEIVSKAISSLPEKEQLIISLYYRDELTLKEIGRVLNLTESRVSQIHSKTILKLRIKLKSYYESE